MQGLPKTSKMYKRIFRTGLVEKKKGVKNVMQCPFKDLTLVIHFSTF